MGLLALALHPGLLFLDVDLEVLQGCTEDSYLVGKTFVPFRPHVLQGQKGFQR